MLTFPEADTVPAIRSLVDDANMLMVEHQFDQPELPSGTLKCEYPRY